MAWAERREGDDFPEMSAPWGAAAVHSAARGVAPVGWAANWLRLERVAEKDRLTCE